MWRAIALVALVVPIAALVQTSSDAAATGANHQMLDHSKMHGQMQAGVPREAGQSAFAAIQEIVGLLEADPGTDWSKVSIDALREHLVDMDAVTLHAAVSSEPVTTGIVFSISGAEPVRRSIRRMVTAHAAAMTGVNGWQLLAVETDGGATLTVTAPASDHPKIRALGFFGILSAGAHHQEHHLSIARGGNAHH